MNLVPFILLVVVPLGFSGEVSAFKIPENRIVGGLLAAKGQFPYTVSLRNSTLGHFCGGSIIKSRYVLTSAKCLQGKAPSAIYVVAGTNSITPSGTIFPVTKITIHANYNSGTLANNIALIRTEDVILDAPRTATIGLSISSAYPGQKCNLTGWGKEHLSLPSFSSNLRYVELTILSLADCQRALPEYGIDNNNVCTTPIGTGGCDGDNGGPLVNYNVQVGILSWGIPCATNKPDVYTNVPSYVNWINANTPA